MGRDPADGDAFVFALIDDDVGGDDAPDALLRPGRQRPDGAADGGPDGAPELRDGASADPVVPTGATRWLRSLAPVAAVLAVVLGTGFALDGVRTAQQLDRIRGVRGGVADLSSPLAERWAWDGPVGVSGITEDWRTVQVAAVGDLLVFVADDKLLALEPASGAEAWSIPLGDDPDCGPTGYPSWEDITTASVVCLHGAPAEREVIVVGPEGVASEARTLDPADTRRYGVPRPGPDGTVLRARRAGDASAVDLGDAVCSSAGDCTGTVESGRDIMLRAEDAVSGAERWSVTAPFEATPAAACNPWRSSAWDGNFDHVSNDPLQPDTFGARIGADLVDLHGCGAGASVTSDGELLRGVEPPGAGAIVGLSTGGYLASGLDITTHTVVYSADGKALETIDGYVVEAAVVDGPGTLLGSDDDSPGIRAYEPDGTPRWDGAPGAGGAQLAAEVGETLVVMDEGVARGLDAATGDQRWELDLSKGADGTYSDIPLLFQVFTDGRHVLLLLHNEDATFDLVSLDTVSGKLSWDEPVADVLSLRQSASLAAVGGHLLAVTPVGVRGLG
jgi:hypothetical protein